MNLKKIEHDINEQRKSLAAALDDINKDLTPGQLLDRYYLKGQVYGTFGLLKKIKEDPIPMTLVGSAIAHSHKNSEDDPDELDQHHSPLTNMALGYSLGLLFRELLPKD